MSNPILPWTMMLFLRVILKVFLTDENIQLDRASGATCHECCLTRTSIAWHIFFLSPQKNDLFCLITRERPPYRVWLNNNATALCNVISFSITSWDQIRVCKILQRISTWYVFLWHSTGNKQVEIQPTKNELGWDFKYDFLHIKIK